MIIGGPRFECERLDEHHQRASFSCTREPALQTYLAEDARAIRENKRSITAVHLIIDEKNGDKIAGYFTLSNTSIIPSALPNAIAKKLPRYDHWPATLLGRMARDDRYAGENLGTTLVGNALEMTMQITTLSASLALIVDAKNDALAVWYRQLGFTPFPDDPNRLFMVNATIADLLARIRATQPVKPNVGALVAQAIPDQAEPKDG